MKYLNKYLLLARYIPGLITLAPASLIYFFVTKQGGDYSLNEYLKSLSFFVDLSGTFVFTFFVSMVVRELGCYLEKKYFKRKLGFPSTYLMLYSDGKLPTQMKHVYGRKIYSDFNLSRLTEVEEAANQQEALKVLSQASRLLSTKFQQNSQVIDANIAYGFARNLSGGLIISLPCSIAGFIMGIVLKQNSLLLWSSVALVILTMLALFHKQWIINNAEKYADKLFSVYLG